MDVLVLNASYEPLKVIDFRRAVVGCKETTFVASLCKSFEQLR